jgi:HNH endonuclease
MKPTTVPANSLLHYEYKAPAGLRARWQVGPQQIGRSDACPYCDMPMPSPTRDHVFPQFLGGQRWIQSCKQCNDQFGHGIEGPAANEIFTPNYVFLSALGLTHIREGATWKNAFVHEGVHYHLTAKGGAVHESLARPVITKDSEGRVTGGLFPNKKMAEPLVQHAIREGRTVQIVTNHDLPKNIPTLVCGLDFGPLILRPALKISLAAASLLEVPRVRLRDAREELRKDPRSPLPRCTVVAIDYADIRRFAKPLSHVVYVESTPERVYGIVQFFGVLQIWCGLSDVPAQGDRMAVCGTLDPITGKERFDFTTALDLPINFGEHIPREAYSIESLAQWIVSGLQEQALKRGGKDLGLRVHSVGLGSKTPRP